MAQNKGERKFINVPMDEDLHQFMKTMAEKNERTIQSEARVAFKKYQEQQQAA